MLSSCVLFRFFFFFFLNGRVRERGFGSKFYSQERLGNATQLFNYLLESCEELETTQKKVGTKAYR